MTMPRYPHGRSAGSKVRGAASSRAAWARESDAWNVNFNNGNADYNHQNNTAFVLACRSARASECQGAKVSFRELFEAWRRARRRKVPSFNQLAFDVFWSDRLFELQQKINAGTWEPGPTSCFVAKRPKAREIHAPDFADRVVHHWLVPQLEALFEPGFIADSFANRRGKGTHAAVNRLRTFVRQVASGQGGGWYLQLDIRNFFNSIHRPTLYHFLKQRMTARGAPVIVQQATHALLRRSVRQQGVVHRCSLAERALVPEHKRLENAAPGCGIPIGNLSSQFFSNVYLDRLDQFVKRTLKVRRYLRYVDDFVLIDSDRTALERALDQIIAFLRVELRLELKDEIKLRPLSAGIDFLGYVIYPTHTRVRRRVVRHAFAALKATERPRTREQRQHRRSVLASYLGHFRHANARKLSSQLAAEAKRK